MDFDEIVMSLVKKIEEQQKLILLVLDGLGDIPHETNSFKTPLEAASTPNLDRLAPRSACGRIIPVDYGITPGSGPAHLGIFGYDPRRVRIGRGVLEAIGVGMDLRRGDVAARANVCTVKDGVVTDRRAGRPATEKTAEVCRLLQEELGRIDDVKVIIQPGRGHRFALIFRGEGLVGGVSDTDPHVDGEPIHESQPENPEARRTAEIVNRFQQAALDLLEGRDPINGILLRGISAPPDISALSEKYGLRCGAVATYPMYRGLASLVGMDLLETGQSVEDELGTCAERWDDYDYFFIHLKPADEAGEDGDFDRKVAAIEEADRHLPILLEKKPEVLTVTGDHSTPCVMKMHSWHPVPLLLNSPRCGADGLERFTERNCITGSLGTFPARKLMALMLANAGLLDKFGA